jgi:hypothetical protein
VRAGEPHVVTVGCLPGEAATPVRTAQHVVTTADHQYRYGQPPDAGPPSFRVPRPEQPGSLAAPIAEPPQRYQSMGLWSWNSSPVGPPSGRVASQTMVPVASSGERSVVP